MTGTKRDRPELAKMLERMTEGDTRHNRIPVPPWEKHQGLDCTHRYEEYEKRQLQFSGHK